MWIRFYLITLITMTMGSPGFTDENVVSCFYPKVFYACTHLEKRGALKDDLVNHIFVIECTDACGNRYQRPFTWQFANFDNNDLGKGTIVPFSNEDDGGVEDAFLHILYKNMNKQLRSLIEESESARAEIINLEQTISPFLSELYNDVSPSVEPNTEDQNISYVLAGIDLMRMVPMPEFHKTQQSDIAALDSGLEHMQRFFDNSTSELSLRYRQQFNTLYPVYKRFATARNDLLNYLKNGSQNGCISVDPQKTPISDNSQLEPSAFEIFRAIDKLPKSIFNSKRLLLDFEVNSKVRLDYFSKAFPGATPKVMEFAQCKGELIELNTADQLAPNRQMTTNSSKRSSSRTVFGSVNAPIEMFWSYDEQQRPLIATISIHPSLFSAKSLKSSELPSGELMRILRANRELFNNLNFNRVEFDARQCLLVNEAHGYNLPRQNIQIRAGAKNLEITCLPSRPL